MTIHTHQCKQCVKTVSVRASRQTPPRPPLARPQAPLLPSLPPPTLAFVSGATRAGNFLDTARLMATTESHVMSKKHVPPTTLPLPSSSISAPRSLVSGAVRRGRPRRLLHKDTVPRCRSPGELPLSVFHPQVPMSRNTQTSPTQRQYYLPKSVRNLESRGLRPIELADTSETNTSLYNGTSEEPKAPSSLSYAQLNNEG
ncbi:hypothetical protein DFH08DRAFT_967655 [Mycena albidolilacea]|uniref:Uncharacterized protein n=1 Tax=Mycena albidolilacea TaxID=1033008 RepID=A0AAD6ZLA9_9AGAR|nr:hypothetical protein DFH08DRAFT_967655 [Mycena albidolilacea]